MQTYVFLSNSIYDKNVREFDSDNRQRYCII